MAFIANNPLRQKGAASLLTAVILLICITLVTFLTAKTVLVETQQVSDSYRTSQATEAASAAMNQGIGYFLDGGLDHDNDDLVDYVNTDRDSNGVLDRFYLTLSSSGQSTTGSFYFDNTTAGNPCDCDTDDDGNPDGCITSTNMTRGRIVAQGWSDDELATRIISQCLTVFNVFEGGESPKQPFISRQSVGVAGNARIINRYNNSSVWSGGSIGVLGASFGTYLRPSNTYITDYTETELNNEDETADTQRVSDRDSGIGIDVITDDPNLGNKTPNDFFDLFFATTKNEVMDRAANIDQKFAVGSNLNTTPPLTGLVWVGDDSATPSTTDTSVSATDVLGTPTNPVILIVNGDFNLNGGTIYGVVYVMGELKVAGNPILKGTLISESGNSSGTGTLNMVYVPYGDDGDQSPEFIKGTGAIVSGSWRDW